MGKVKTNENKMVLYLVIMLLLIVVASAVGAQSKPSQFGYGTEAQVENLNL